MATTQNIYGIKFTALCFLLPLLLLSSCKKLIEIDPPIDQITAGELYSTNSGAASVLSGIYYSMNTQGFSGGQSGLSLRLGLAADELKLLTGSADLLSRLYTNSLVRTDDVNWTELYGYIFKANAAIEGITVSASLSENVRKQLLGEAKFVRAFCYFNLTNIFGEVPLVISTNYNENSKAPKSHKELVYAQIKKDLQEAHDQLSADYIGSDGVSAISERIVPNSIAASALLARVYLYTNDWSNAESSATEVIQNVNYNLPALNEVFLKNSSEAIWQLERGKNYYNTDGQLFILENGLNTATNPVYLSPQLLNSFEAGDLRYQNWINKYEATGNTYYYAYKYKEGVMSDFNYTEYTMVLRLAEQYLIRAEARAEQDRIIGANSASEDIDMIRSRAGLGNTTASNKEDMRSAILRERKVELFTEWGHRWFDMKRLEIINTVMDTVTPLKGGDWASYKVLFPIYQLDIEKSPGLAGQQNTGY